MLMTAAPTSTEHTSTRI